MKEKAKSSLHSVRIYTLAFLKWAALAIVVGAAGGFVGVAFHFAVDFVTEFRVGHSWMLYLLPVAGILIVLLYRAARLPVDPGTNRILLACRSNEHVPPALAPLIFIATTLTHACGGSAGREGAALQLGGSIGNVIGRLVRFRTPDLHIATMCGMSAVFSALFGTPITAAVFCMEVGRVGAMGYAAIVPCVGSALMAVGIADAFGVPPTAFSLPSVPSLGAVSALQVAALAILCVVCSLLFIFAMHGATHLYEKLFKNAYLRVLVASALIIGVTLLTGTRDYNGAGMDVITRAIGGTALPWAFALKILLTALTIGGGFKGGEIVPTFFIGSTFGCVMGGLLGLDPGFGAAVGLVCLFCCVVNCPLASIVLSVELFGAAGLPLFALACAIGFLLSSYTSLYSAQIFTVSKLTDAPKDAE